MQLDPQQLDQQILYKLLAGSVIPRPIAWVSTIDVEGTPNLAPYSFFNAIGSNPPTLCFAAMHAAERSAGKKDTLHNIEATGQFVVNLVSEALAEAMNTSAADLPAGISEFALAGITAAPSERVKPPRVGESPVSFECELFSSVPVGEGPGSSTLVIGRIVFIHIREDIVDERFRVDMGKLQLIGRIAGSDYVHLRDVFSMVRPRYNQQTGELDRYNTTP